MNTSMIAKKEAGNGAPMSEEAKKRAMQAAKALASLFPAAARAVQVA